MSKKLIKTANERDQKSIFKYTKATEANYIIHSKENSDITVLTSTERQIELKDITLIPKRKRSQETSPAVSECSKPSKLINLSRSPVEKETVQDLRSGPQKNEMEEDESTLSPELAKLERILSRKHIASLEGIKNDIKLLLETEKLIKKQQDAIDELKKENYELNVKCNKLEKNQSRLKKRVSVIENELYSSNVIIHGVSENEDEDGPECYRLVTEVLATTIYAATYEEQIQIARKIPIKKTYRFGRYNS